MIITPPRDAFSIILRPMLSLLSHADGVTDTPAISFLR